MAKKANDNVSNEILNNKIVLKSCYGKTGSTYFIQPHINPNTGRYPDSVRKTNASNDMILSPEDLSSGKYFIKDTEVFEIHDNYTFDLDDPVQAAQWEAIKYCPLIAESRDAKDASGNYKIDGTVDTSTGKPRYGKAELYIDRPGLMAQKKVKSKEIEHKAISFILDSDIDKNRLICRVFGRSMDRATTPEVTEFLISIAEKTPNKIIEAYSGGDLSLKLLLIAAKDKGIIKVTNGIYCYGEDQSTVLGSSEDTVITWMKMPANAKVLSLIKKDTFPEMTINN